MIRNRPADDIVMIPTKTTGCSLGGLFAVGLLMRTSILLLTVAALVVVVIIAATPHTEVTFNEAGTEVLGINVLGAMTTATGPRKAQATTK
jgi:hypothetical protein